MIDIYYSQTVMLLNRLSGLLVALTATVTGCSASQLSRDWKEVRSELVTVLTAS